MKKNVVYKLPIIKEVSKKAGIPQVQAEFVYHIMMDEIYKHLRKGSEVLLPNIGRIGFTEVLERKSNLTHQHIPPHKKIRFFPNVSLARYIRVNTRKYPINQVKVK